MALKVSGTVTFHSSSRLVVPRSPMFIPYLTARSSTSVLLPAPSGPSTTMISITSQVVDNLPQVLLYKTQLIVATPTQESSDSQGLVVVIEVKSSSLGLLATDRTSSILLFH